MAGSAGKLTVYYDASCPWCESEMCAIRARDRHGRLETVDCSTADFPGAGGASREQMMRLLHVRDEHGEWLVGIAAYQAILDATGFPRIARVLGHRRVRPALDRLYAWLATHRHRFPRASLARWLLRKRRPRAGAS